MTIKTVYIPFVRPVLPTGEKLEWREVTTRLYPAGNEWNSLGIVKAIVARAKAEGEAVYAGTGWTEEYKIVARKYIEMVEEEDMAA